VGQVGVRSALRIYRVASGFVPVNLNARTSWEGSQLPVTNVVLEEASALPGAEAFPSKAGEWFNHFRVMDRRERTRKPALRIDIPETTAHFHLPAMRTPRGFDSLGITSIQGHGRPDRWRERWPDAGRGVQFRV